MKKKMAVELIKKFNKLVCYPSGKKEGGGFTYLPVQELNKEELLDVIKNPSFDRYQLYLSPCSCGCQFTVDPRDIIEAASIRPDAIDFLRNERFYDGEEEFLLDSYYNLIQMTGVNSIDGKCEKIDILIDYMWNWLCSINEKLILDYRHHEYGTSILHSILYGHHTEKMMSLVDRFLDLWDKHYPDLPLPEAEGEDNEDPQTIEYLLTWEVMPVQLERVLRRKAYTSNHLKWQKFIYRDGLIGTKTYLVSRRNSYNQTYWNMYDDCIRMLEEIGGMPSEVDHQYLEKKNTEEEPVDWTDNYQ